MWVRGYSRSLKMISFESLGTISYSPSIATMAVSLAISEIFSDKEWTDRQSDRRTDRQICYINITRQYADAR